jgi:uncharacterized protein (DUF433 family)
MHGLCRLLIGSQASRVERTRIMVQTVLEFLRAGDSVEDVLKAYPSLQRVDVLAGLKYAADKIR